MKAIVTGAAGFAGCNLIEQLIDRGQIVYAIVRPDSEHNSRLRGLSDNLRLVELDCSEYDKLPNYITEECDITYHLAWFGDRYNLDEQMENIHVLDELIKTVSALGCKRIVCTGSQAEYGPCSSIIDETTWCHPIDAYGTAKLAAMYLSKQRAADFEMEWIWGRIFSLYGKYEPDGRLMPMMIQKMLKDEEIFLSSCEQNWDYLDAKDAADAIISLGERGISGEIYNIANGAFKPLREYVEQIKQILDSKSGINYGERANPFFSLSPNVKKIKRDTGWEAVSTLELGINDYIKWMGLTK